MKYLLNKFRIPGWFLRGETNPFGHLLSDLLWWRLVNEGLSKANMFYITGSGKATSIYVLHLGVGRHCSILLNDGCRHSDNTTTSALIQEEKSSWKQRNYRFPLVCFRVFLSVWLARPPLPWTEVFIVIVHLTEKTSAHSSPLQVVGGMTWCITTCNFDIDVDLLFQENSTIGQKMWVLADFFPSFSTLVQINQFKVTHHTSHIWIQLKMNNSANLGAAQMDNVIRYLVTFFHPFKCFSLSGFCSFTLVSF